MSCKSKLASRYEEGKNMSPQTKKKKKKRQIKTNPDDATYNIFKYKVVLNEV